jgi:hypothetical protein
LAANTGYAFTIQLPMRSNDQLQGAAISTAGYCGFLSGLPLIGLVAEHLGLGAGLGLVAIVLGIVALAGSGAASGRGKDGRLT